MKEKIYISLNIQSNVNYPQRINILGSNYNQLDTSNAKTEYRYDMTAFAFSGETRIAIQYKTVSDLSYSYYYRDLSGQTLQSCIEALNLLGIGYFNLYVNGGNVYISTYNDSYVFGVMTIYNPATPQLLYNWNTIAAGGDNNIDINAVNQISDSNPTTASGIVVVVAGDTATVYGTTSSNPKGAFFEISTVQGGVIYSDFVSGAFTHSFPIASGFTYVANLTDVP